MDIKKKLYINNSFKKNIRNFFAQHSYIEVDTPILVRAPGTEIHLDYFSTQWIDHHKKNHELWLRSSPELHMKQMLCEDLGAVFQIAKCFRNGGELSDWHHPEFTMIEWYKKNISYFDFISETQKFIEYLLSTMKQEFPQDIHLNLPHKIEKISVYEAFQEFAGISLVDEDKDLAEKARSKGILSPCLGEDFETSFFKILIEKVEPALAKIPFCVLYDYPPSQSALAIVEKGVARRFEFYIHGIEISNAFFELLDPKENLKRIKDSNKQRQKIAKQKIIVDDEFITSLENKIPPTCGNALGYNRLLSLFCGAQDIEPSMIFRKMKPFC